METQPGTRAALVDPFGRELEQWLRDSPSTTNPYVSDLVVPPVTGPVRRPETAAPGAADSATVDTATVDTATDVESPAAVVVPDDAARAFRRDRGRHASVCAPSFPEPPARISLSFGDLAVEVSSESGRSTIERIAFLEEELDRRDADLARLAAWEAQVDESDDPEVAAARAFAAAAFADVLAEALAERTELDRRARLRAAAPILQSVSATTMPADAGVNADATSAIRTDATSATHAVAVGPVVSPEVVFGPQKPTPLVQPATGPNAIHRAAFEEAVRTHSGHTVEVPTIFPLDPITDASTARAATAGAVTADAATGEAAPVPAATRPSWWSRFIAGLLRIVRR